ncbi:hypothetical protein [Vibrio sp. HN007]|uniref:hypothetical protein n=1 Tax=Vibrio iocasae TaxID=3098914 RepID=UPI0035D3ECAF
MKKTIIAISVISSLSFNALAQKVDVAAANFETEKLITEQMVSIDASVQAALDALYSDAQIGDVVAYEYVAYEKQSNGTWAVIGGTSAALVAGLLSTNSSSTSGDELPVFPSISNPIETTPGDQLPTHPIPDNDLPVADGGMNKHHVQVNDNEIIVNGKTAGTFTNDNGKVTIHTATQDRYDIYVLDLGNGNIRIKGQDFHINEHGVIGKGHIFDTPNNDLPVVDGGIEKHHIQITDIDSERNTALIKVNGEVIGSMDYKDGQLFMYTKDGIQQYETEIISHDRLDNTFAKVGETWVMVNQEGVVTRIDRKKAESAVKNLDRSKIQNIDQNNLQRARTVINQRING